MMEPVKETGWKIIGSDITWFVPCESLAFLNNSSNYKVESCDSEQDISSDYLVTQDAGIGETATLIAQSVADPAMRDTLKISIIAKAN
jgi:spore coat protein CotF